MIPRGRALRAAIVAALALLPLGAAAADSGAPARRQSRPPQQIAQACRTLCVQEFNACQRSCDNTSARIDCQARCQTRFNLCTSTCP